ncbi:hypothetical protein AWM75_06230 [Aerococcus urinaehominis]|uniref:Oligoendopeptidase n=1 Tax=Aerococcus urinaehominis TaxID=128944 RepID=A0A0X8FLN0_9LACT|nr:M3 family oligoendopeptidase [Aerococcus urinaehominis]AMB99602.1 hypothetical protein AWM75_06230 [Aerococcus urinaehominis]SDL87059.1 oligoendopeptidase, pepF/M3 family [Aerococcus urinaehominis]
MNVKNTWDFDSIYPGGLSGQDFSNDLAQIQHELKQLTCASKQFKLDTNNLPAWESLLADLMAAELKLGQLITFVQMVADNDIHDSQPGVYLDQLASYQQIYLEAYQAVIRQYGAVTESDWHRAINSSSYLQSMSLVLNEGRQDSLALLAPETERLVAALDKDGLAAWSQIYDTASSALKISFQAEGEIRHLSVGQAQNRLSADPDPQVRETIFQAWEEAFSRQENLFADILNHLAGYRLTLQTEHGDRHALTEPLRTNRMTKASLDSIWQVVTDNKSDFIAYLAAKADLLGVDRLAWQDVEAPLPLAGEDSELSFEEAGHFVVDQFSKFGPKLANFAKQALANHIVEAENRDNKRPGGYCTDVPFADGSRIFMTFTGAMSDTQTLAHELGHAFHSQVLLGEKWWNQKYPMNLAETASTLNELIVADASLQAATSIADQLKFLDLKLNNAIAMFMNIHARFIFEDKFYQQRRQGILTAQALNDLMVAAQREAYQDSLASYHPHFWASKLHFYIDQPAFYNFPYTFGYLFSLGLYARYQEQPEGFEDWYINLLRDTGKLTAEDLALKHLGQDLSQPDFWQAAIDISCQDAKRFVQLAKAYQEGAR